MTERRAREAWIYVVSFIDSLAYYAFSYALILHLGQEVGLPDSMAGLFYGIFGVCISVSGVFMGFAADWLGVRNSICIASAVGFMGRLAMAYAVLGRSSWLSTLLLCAVVGPCIALMLPPIPIAIKRYTTEETAGMAQTINYGVTNMASFLATPVVDLLRMGNDDTVLLLPPYALLIAIAGLLQVPIFFAAIFGLRDGTFDPVTGDLRDPKPDTKGLAIKQRMRSVLSQPNFKRALILVVCLMGVKSSFRYFDALYLPYVSRAHNDAAHFPYLSLLAMNPIICSVATLTGAITILTGRLEPVRTMLAGALVGGLAPFWMALGPFVVSIMLYVLCTTLGEIVWAPVAVAYFMALAGDGDEGAYSALAGLPVFLAKMMTGVLTGTLLTNYCPEHRVNGTLVVPPPPQLWGTPSHCNGLAIWSIIGVTTLSSFVALLLLRNQVRMPATSASLLKVDEDVDNLLKGATSIDDEDVVPLDGDGDRESIPL